MTTKVTVEACCADDIQVHVEVYENINIVEEKLLENGEVAEYYIYDNRNIFVKECTK